MFITFFLACSLFTILSFTPSFSFSFPIHCFLCTGSGDGAYIFRKIILQRTVYAICAPPHLCLCVCVLCNPFSSVKNVHNIMEITYRHNSTMRSACQMAIYIYRYVTHFEALPGAVSGKKFAIQYACKLL